VSHGTAIAIGVAGIVSVSVLALGAVTVAAYASTAGGRNRARDIGGGIVGEFSKWFTLDKLTRSGTAKRLGLDNTPPDEAVRALRALTSHVLDPLRDALGVPIEIERGYSSPEVNAKIPGASPDSQHVKGEAADIVALGYSHEALAARIVALGLPFDQLIWYAPERTGSTHVSYTERRPNRGETLYAPAAGGYVAATPRGHA
jgi:zinc D-Ala-D-Ala carboxypeptidase